MDDLGIGWEVLREINPRLIYATGTGFGISGPDRDNLAMDLTIQAASGIMSVTGAPDGPPMKAGPTLVDFMGGIHLYAAILPALYHQCRPRRPHGRDRRARRRVDKRPRQDGCLRPHQGAADPVRAGAHRARGHARPAYARARDAGGDRPPRIGADRGADLAVTPARGR